jgi:hypothetical protein
MAVPEAMIFEYVMGMPHGSVPGMQVRLCYLFLGPRVSKPSRLRLAMAAIVFPNPFLLVKFRFPATPTFLT